MVGQDTRPRLRAVAGHERGVQAHDITLKAIPLFVLVCPPMGCTVAQYLHSTWKRSARVQTGPIAIIRCRMFLDGCLI